MTREDLIGFKHRNKWIDRMLDIYEERAAKIDKVTQTFSGMPKAKNKPNYQREMLMDSCNKMLGILYQEQEKLNEIVLVVAELPATPQLLLTDFYIAGMKLEDTAEDIGYAYENTSRMKRNGSKPV